MHVICFVMVVFGFTIIHCIYIYFNDHILHSDICSVESMSRHTAGKGFDLNPTIQDYQMAQDSLLPMGYTC